MVRDTELLKCIDALFEKEIVLFGAGEYGYRTFCLLSKCGIGVRCFADNDEKKTGRIFGGCRIISVSELQKLCMERDVAIIIASIRYEDEIIEGLHERGLQDACIYTYYALKYALELHINDDRIEEGYRNDFKLNREIWRRNNYICNRMMPAIFQLSALPDILVYQPSKVASSTMFVSLRSAGIDSVQIHTFRPDEEYVSCMSHPGFFADKRFQFILDDLQFYERYYQQRTKTTKIITMVREPVARDISEYFTLFGKGDYILNDRVCADTYKGVEDLLKDLSRIGTFGYEFEWFDRELKRFTGIDIFDYPFDRKKGYSVIKQGNTEILVLKVEKMNDNEKVIADFVGYPDFKIVMSNIGEKNSCKYMYREVKQNMSIPQEVIDRYYKDNKRMDYFYSEEEKESFLKKYRIQGE